MTEPQSTRREVVLPELGLGTQSIRVSVWLVDAGDEVCEGDRLLEVLSHNVTIDVPATATGVLVEQTVSEGESLRTGQLLGVIAEEISDS